MTGKRGQRSGKQGNAYFMRGPMFLAEAKDTGFMAVLKQLERCSDSNMLCDECWKLDECRGQFDYYIEKYVDNPQRVREKWKMMPTGIKRNEIIKSKA